MIQLSPAAVDPLGKTIRYIRVGRKVSWDEIRKNPGILEDPRIAFYWTRPDVSNNRIEDFCE